MKIYNANKIIPGLIIFLGLITFPMWYAMGKAAPPPEIKIDTPVIQADGSQAVHHAQSGHADRPHAAPERLADPGGAERSTGSMWPRTASSTP